MKKCKCGKEIEDRWDLCYECNQKARESEGMTRDELIQRQVAAKCAAQEIAGRIPAEGHREEVFNHYLKLIQGA